MMSRVTRPLATVLVSGSPTEERMPGAAALVWLLDASSAVLLRLLRVRASGQPAVTAEELHMLFADATRSGVIEHAQHQMLQSVVRLAERPVREVMTPRNQLDWIDADADTDRIRAAIEASSHSCCLLYTSPSPRDRG